MIGIYTAIFGAYDNLAPALFGKFYNVLFTDQNIKPNGWIVKRVEQLPVKDDPSKSARYFFCQSCWVMPQFEYTIEHSANVQLRMKPEQMVEEFLPDGYDIATFAHPHRDDVYREAHVCGHWCKDDKHIIKRQMDRYRKEGFPGKNLSACILVIRRNTEQIRELEALWWEEVRKGSRRNQLSFDYCCWKLGVKVARIPGNPYQVGHIMKTYKHALPERRY